MMEVIFMLYLTYCVVFAPVLLLAGIKDKLEIGEPVGRFVLGMLLSVLPILLLIAWTLPKATY